MAAGAVVVGLVVAGLPKIPDPKMVLVVLVVDELAAEGLLSPVAVAVPAKSPLLTLGGATKKVLTFPDS